MVNSNFTNFTGYAYEYDYYPGSADSAYYPDSGTKKINKARKYWDKLPLKTKQELASELESKKQFKMYVQALILETLNM